VFLSIIFRENKWLQNQNQNLPFDLVHNWGNNFLIISPNNNLIGFHNHNQIAFGGKNNKQNQILLLLIYHLHRLNNNPFIFHGSIPEEIYYYVPGATLHNLNLESVLDIQYTFPYLLKLLRISQTLDTASLRARGISWYRFDNPNLTMSSHWLFISFLLLPRKILQGPAKQCHL
jgi:hypothetical protein